METEIDMAQEIKRYTVFSKNLKFKYKARHACQQGHKVKTDSIGKDVHK